MSFMRSIVNKFLDVPAHERIKILILAACYFCILATYTVIRELRDALFVNIVGCEYVQYAQLLSIVFLIPTLFIYAYLVDRLKKHQLLYVYTLAYAIGGIIIAYYVGHPIIGILNTHVHSGRWFGWLLFLFVESYPAFVLSLFLSYVNSVTPQTTMKQSYSVIIAGSKLGGIIVSLFGWWFLGSVSMAEVSKIQILLIIASCFVMFVPLLIRYLIKKIPDAYLHGYEASYQHDQKVEEKEQKEPQHWYSSIVRSFSGLTYIIKYPYAFGIFALVLYWEILNIMLGFQRLKVCYALHKTSISGLGSTLFMQTFWIHSIGFFIALIGTRVFLERLGERRSLIMIPVISGLLIFFYFMSSTATGLLACFILIRSFNFSLGISVREALYIPTTKVMRFKTKSWIDTFGAKCARGTGSVCSLLAECTTNLSQIYLSLSLGIIGIWIVTAHLMGKRFEKVIQDNDVIG